METRFELLCHSLREIDHKERTIAYFCDRIWNVGPILFLLFRKEAKDEIQRNLQEKKK